MERIKTEALSISYEDHLVVEGLDLTLTASKITSIIGPNGCGKSTILKAIGRVLKSNKGVVSLDGSDISQLPTKELAKKMAILPQTPTAPSGLTVAELIAYGRFPHQKGFGRLRTEDREIIEWSLKVTKLTNFSQREVDSLSGGQRQRVWIAMALAQQTELILLDEPTTYLDLAHQLEILELLKELNQSQHCTIVMVLHDLNLAARFSDYMIGISQGKIISQGTPVEVMTPEVLRAAFQIEAEIMIEPKTQRPICLTYDLV